MTCFPVGKRLIFRALALGLGWLCIAPASSAAPTGKSVPRVQVGVASWHSPTGCGCGTASHRRWVGTEMIAAHRSLPLGTKVRVVNLANGHEAIVQITDRGPYCHGRIIDVSRVAAQQLGLIHAGTARVRLEMLPADAPHEQAKILVAFRDGPLLD